MVFEKAYVHSTAPLTVRLRGSSTDLPAVVISGSSYSPAVGQAVLVVFVDKKVIILGGV